MNGAFVEWTRDGCMDLNLFIVTNVWESPRVLDTWELCENSVTGQNQTVISIMEIH